MNLFLTVLSPCSTNKKGTRKLRVKEGKKEDAQPQDSVYDEGEPARINRPWTSSVVGMRKAGGGPEILNALV